MTRIKAPGDRLAAWCGGVLIVLALATPPMAYLGPLGFAPLLALAGVAMVPAVRVRDEDRPLAALLFAALLWAAVSTLWTPYHGGAMTPLKLALQLPLFWAAWCGARRADQRIAGWALQLLSWGMAAFGLLMLVEALLGAGLYQAVRTALYQPIRPDLAAKNLGQSSFVLALLWPLAALGGARAGASPWLGAPMVAGLAAAAYAFGADAPVISIGLAALSGVLVWKAPRGGPRGLGITACVFFLSMPAIVWGVRACGKFEALQPSLPQSWADRTGYWSHAVNWIVQHPLRGWGLDASRTFSPGIQLHPHDSALQLWLELGAPGAILCACVWLSIFLRLVRPRPDAAAAVAAATACVYLLFGALNFGIWQEWWLALGAYAAVLAAACARQPEARFESL